MEEKTDLITISSRKNVREWPVLNQIGQLRPWGVVQNRDRNVVGDGGKRVGEGKRK